MFWSFVLLCCSITPTVFIRTIRREWTLKITLVSDIWCTQPSREGRCFDRATYQMLYHLEWDGAHPCCKKDKKT
ncbi:hypothetical protein BC939DRAFT_466655 [Gamsiella multidivaricata]|uniref:uncharacterized protein n=1 Tax=Gamsiella multidivaricata TaxID=101098 RepID=UPI002220F254|nr:uncharacterized protein BC939DRAFT_466655 [Gamsiella multidivaricata]KAI7817220.1 hypothetical protein BC939DRAFT_466655 [Gamsiella multidivaricata]